MSGCPDRNHGTELSIGLVKFSYYAAADSKEILIKLGTAKDGENQSGFYFHLPKKRPICQFLWTGMMFQRL
jgi:hypothetical protein